MKKVVKFGGSSLADAGQFKKVADIIHADDSRVFVVPSAALASPSSFKNVTVPTAAIATTNTAIITVRIVFVFPFIFYLPFILPLLLLR